MWAFGSQAGLEHLFFLSLQSSRVRLMVPYHTLVLTHTQINTRTLNASGLFTTACRGWWGKKKNPFFFFLSLLLQWVHAHIHIHTHARTHARINVHSPYFCLLSCKHVTKQSFQVRISDVQPTLRAAAAVVVETHISWTQILMFFSPILCNYIICAACFT